MKIVLAFDSFKGSLTAQEACRIVSSTLASIRPSWKVISKPMADGGEGTSQTILSAIHGEWCPCRVMGPLPDRQVEAGYIWLPEDRAALIEMATASGITLIPESHLNPMLTTTYGTGELMMKALERQPRRILLAVGGSATVDGGVGAAMALGWRFLDVAGREVELGGNGLEQISQIISPPDCGSLPPIEVLCDVTNPLCGERGAAVVYGPQKGATADMVRRLDIALSRLAYLMKMQTGRDIAAESGAGAAGGLAAGAMAFMGARLVPGVEAVMNVCGVEKAMQGADWVITGEGRLDHQSFQGKVVSGIVNAARRNHVKVAVIAGQIALSESEWRDSGVAQAYGLVLPGTFTPEMIKETAQRLENSVRVLAEAMSG